MTFRPCCQALLIWTSVDRIGFDPNLNLKISLFCLWLFGWSPRFGCVECGKLFCILCGKKLLLFGGVPHAPRVANAFLTQMFWAVTSGYSHRVCCAGSFPGWGRTHSSILIHLWEKLHPNAIENLSGQNQIWPQILTKVWQVFFVKDHLLGKMFDQNQMTNHIFEHFSI